MSLEFDHDISIVANSVIVDELIYEHWLNGNSAQETCHFLIKRDVLSEMEGADEACVRSDVNDHYRLFYLAEKFLENPKRMKEQCHLQLAADTCDMLIEKYYDFDGVVIREFFGKKFFGKSRKDLDDISEKTKIPLKSCRRQFDNFRRVIKTIEDVKHGLIECLINNFLISESLARKYAAAIFITLNKFETSKKRLNYLTFDDFVVCANAMMQFWSTDSLDLKDGDISIEIDKEFMENLKDFKLYQDKEIMDEIKANALKRMEKEVSEKAFTDFEANFKALFKMLVNIAVELNHSSDLRDFFVDLVEKFVEPCKNLKIGKIDLKAYLRILNETIHSHDALTKPSPPLASTWDRYINVVSVCVLAMLHR